jgi:thioester reductase-like protein
MQQFESLTQSVTAIYHNGTWVNVLLPYEKLRASNVLGKICAEFVSFYVKLLLLFVHFFSFPTF